MRHHWIAGCCLGVILIIAWDRIALLKRRRREARDCRILDRKARVLNSEAIDVLQYHADW